ncbi:uncharacterized protein Z519_01243 [Cladophialophora bantiana CBS 173.52]|uniref:HTH araC/xylS-type domain-containing protein n=1 Tax=Cladophialophora bantiana (strain ATCC 10958 / CBS 173.52 / CDC B-1940 / NIH 8579) TaxID=1442370 RepID=A0A0D2ILI0_CLAB1|nr:uncharacterized protein Z519_01243 [Cladophialophora bantiana CBS 173.52]KIW97659.1 hypothetical protein Z519_01243 [Cladophialophora bantiana CBS 173.52]
MSATISPDTMNFPFSYPYDDNIMFDCSPAMTMVTTTLATATATEALLLPPRPAPVSLPLQLPPQQIQQLPHFSSSNTPSQSSPSAPSTSPPSAYRSETSRWKALVARDPQATNVFVYAVVTTKIYCRPDCRARLARRANVRFFDQAAQAERAGFRACKRCRPNRAKLAYGDVSPLSSSFPWSESRPGPASGDEFVPGLNTPVTRSVSSGSVSVSESAETSPGRDGDVDVDDIHTKIQRAVHLVCHSASEKGQPLSLSQLAGQVGLSKWHLQRVFKKLQGVTPREMAEHIIQAKAEGLLTATTMANPMIMMPNDTVPTQAIQLCAPVSKSRVPSSPCADDLAFPPAPPLPLMDTSGTDWFDDQFDSGADCSYHQHQQQQQQHQRQRQRQEGHQLPAHFEEDTQTMTMTVDNAAMEVEIEFMERDLHQGAAAADCSAENILNDLFSEILVYNI